MIENKALKKMYREAKKEGFVYDVETAECNSKCINCPAYLACEQLSTVGATDADKYKAFKENYSKLFKVPIEGVI